MKQFKLLTALVLLLIVACKKDRVFPFFEITPETTELYFAADGKSVSYGSGYTDAPAVFTVNTNEGKWNVISDESWLHITQKNNTFSISVDPVDTLPNRWDRYRHTSVNIKIGESGRGGMFVLQNAALYVYPSTRNAVLPLSGGSTTFSVSTSRNAEWDAVSDQIWLQVNKNVSEGKLILSAAANTGLGEPPPAVVTVTSGTSSIIINVRQDAPWLNVTPTGSVVFSASGATARINGEPFLTMSFNVSTNTQSPIVVSPSSSIYWVGIGTFIVNGIVTGFRINAMNNSRTNPHPAGNITVIAGNAPPVIIPVSQEPAP
ncbi:MAG: hypothetical protein LBP85_09445 [Prevotellaceae bacterium]|jgi:hypothetical protein|nr:hypothetical protein [Prevotellaceae bacterium]